jgi:hypothetical protein
VLVEEPIAFSGPAAARAAPGTERTMGIRRATLTVEVGRGAGSTDSGRGNPLRPSGSYTDSPLMSPNLDRWTAWGTVSSGFRKIEIGWDQLESVGVLAPFLAPA